jgi:hypothetical protein
MLTSRCVRPPPIEAGWPRDCRTTPCWTRASLIAGDLSRCHCTASFRSFARGGVGDPQRELAGPANGPIFIKTAIVPEIDPRCQVIAPLETACGYRTSLAALSPTGSDSPRPQSSPRSRRRCFDRGTARGLDFRTGGWAPTGHRLAGATGVAALPAETDRRRLELADHHGLGVSLPDEGRCSEH